MIYCKHSLLPEAQGQQTASVTWSSMIYKADSDWLSFQRDSSIHPPLLLGRAMTDTAMGVGNFLLSLRLASCSSEVEDTRTTKQINSKKCVMPRNDFTGIKRDSQKQPFQQC